MEIKKKASAVWGRIEAALERPKIFSLALVVTVLVIFANGGNGSAGAFDNHEFTFSIFAMLVDVFDRKLLGALAICAIYTAITGKLRPSVVLIALVVSAIEQKESFFATVVHPFILQHAEILYTVVFWRGAETVSAEFPRLLLMITVLVVTLVQISVKRWRTFDRLLLGVSYAGVMGTFIIFHTVAVVHVKNFSDMQKTHMRSIFISYDKGYIERACGNEKLDCWVGTPAMLDALPDSVPQTIHSEFSYFAPDMKNYPGGDIYYVSFAKDNSFTRWPGYVVPDFLSYVPVYFAFDKQRNIALLAVNNYSHAGYLMMNLKIQSILVCIAHTAWFIVLMALWMFHRAMFRKRLARQSMHSPASLPDAVVPTMSGERGVEPGVRGAGRWKQMLYVVRWVVAASILVAGGIWAYLQVGGFYA